MPRWQYKVVVHRALVGIDLTESREDPERDELLNRYGQEGWELVSVISQSYRREYDSTAHYGYAMFSYFFKKKIDQDEG
jgi:hypothetical protein